MGSIISSQHGLCEPEAEETYVSESSRPGFVGSKLVLDRDVSDLVFHDTVTSTRGISARHLALASTIHTADGDSPVRNPHAPVSLAHPLD